MNDVPNCLSPTPIEQIARAENDLRMGLPCLLQHGVARTVIVGVEPLTAARFAALQARFGAPELVITAHRAWAVMTPSAASHIAASPVRIRPPENADLTWFKELADTQCRATTKPAGPLHTVRDGDDIAHRLAVELVKAAEMLPAAVAFSVPADDALNDLALTPLDTDLALEILAEQPPLMPVAAAGLPLEAHDVSRLHVFRDEDGRTEHYAIVIGEPDPAFPVLARLHSACFTGDVLGSLKCDCGPQLRTALAQMGAEGAGVLMYLNQEGRGIGLANKMRVYDLQAQGLDTVDANHHLGFEDDERDFRVAASMLRTLGIASLRLLTNNPAKIDTFEANGISIAEQLPLRMGRNAHNHGYLTVKALKSGHLL